MADNFLDRAIEAVAPGWAVRRTLAREQLATHRGGVATRTGRPWGRDPSYKGGTTSGRFNQGSRSDRARKVYAEHPIGRALLKTETDNVVSAGFTLQASTPDKAFNDEVENRWNDWLDIADIRGILPGVDLVRQFYRSPRRDGDGGIVLVDRGGESRLQYIPRDLIGTGLSGKWGPDWVDGIQVDLVGRPVAFNIRDLSEWTGEHDTVVPAGNFIYLAPEIDDDLGLRGDSCYSTIFGYLDQIDGYIDAVIIAARMAAVFGLVEKSDAGVKQISGLGSLMNSQGQQQSAMTLENGMLKRIGNKDDVMQVIPQQPMNQTPDFIRAIARLLGLPFDMPLELVLKDLSQVNFSSARVGLLQYYRACRARQKSFTKRCLARIYRWWLSREINRGRILAANGAPASADLLAHKFLAEGWDYTDPVSEIQADWMQVALGTKNKHQICAERGRDYEETVLERQVERATERLAGLPEVELNTTRDRIEVATPEPKPAPEDAKAAADAAFKRQAWLGFQADGTVADVAANLTNLRQLTVDVGLPVDPKYTEPWLPVQDAAGNPITGGSVKDAEGDVVGGETSVANNGTQNSGSVTITGAGLDMQATAELLNSVGVAVRAGVLTPTTGDEDAIRAKLGMPPMSADAREAWTEEGGVRRPITLAGTQLTAAADIKQAAGTENAPATTTDATGESAGNPPGAKPTEPANVPA